MEGLALDVGLLRGFRYRCRPDCGLCCFTSPAVTPDEWRGLRTLQPQLTAVRSGREVCVAARPDGGACSLLLERRCTAHVARPAPCREFPLSVHVGERLQATVVLSCPGVELSGLLSGALTSPPVGFEEELAALERRLGPDADRRRADAIRRRRKVQRLLEADGRWEDEERSRSVLGPRLSVPGPEFFPATPPPPIDGPWEELPMYFDGRAGPVALGERSDGWEAVELSATGGGTSLGVAVPPQRPPEIDAGGRALLLSYLRYWLSRDAFFGALHLELLETRAGPAQAEASRTLSEIGASAISAAHVRAQFRRGAVGPLRVDDIERGIRAVDLDWVDRATWGGRL